MKQIPYNYCDDCMYSKLFTQELEYSNSAQKTVYSLAKKYKKLEDAIKEILNICPPCSPECGLLKVNKIASNAMEKIT